MSDLLKPDNMLSDAQFNIEWRKKEIIKAKIRYDFTDQPIDKRDLDRHLRELVIEENYLKVLLARLDMNPVVKDKPRIVKWALGE